MWFDTLTFETSYNNMCTCSHQWSGEGGQGEKREAKTRESEVVSVLCGAVNKRCEMRVAREGRWERMWNRGASRVGIRVVCVSESCSIVCEGSRAYVWLRVDAKSSKFLSTTHELPYRLGLAWACWIVLFCTAPDQAAFMARLGCLFFLSGAQISHWK
jgi:hypothetical protein